MLRSFFEYWARRRQRTAAQMQTLRGEWLEDAGYCLDRPESMEQEPY